MAGVYANLTVVGQISDGSGNPKPVLNVSADDSVAPTGPLPVLINELLRFASDGSVRLTVTAPGAGEVELTVQANPCHYLPTLITPGWRSVAQTASALGPYPSTPTVVYTAPAGHSALLTGLADDTGDPDNLSSWTVRRAGVEYFVSAEDEGNHHERHVILNENDELVVYTSAGTPPSEVLAGLIEFDDGACYYRTFAVELTSAVQTWSTTVPAGESWIVSPNLPSAGGDSGKNSLDLIVAGTNAADAGNVRVRASVTKGAFVGWHQRSFPVLTAPFNTLLLRPKIGSMDAGTQVTLEYNQGTLVGSETVTFLFSVLVKPH